MSVPYNACSVLGGQSIRAHETGDTQSCKSLCVLRIEPRSSGRAAVLLTTKSLFLPLLLVFKKKNYLSIFIFHVHWCFAPMYVCVRVSNHLALDYSCELPYGCWELNSGPLQGHQGFLITEPSLRPQIRPESSPRRVQVHLFLKRMQDQL